MFFSLIFFVRAIFFCHERFACAVVILVSAKTDVHDAQGRTQGGGGSFPNKGGYTSDTGMLIQIKDPGCVTDQLFFKGEKSV